MSNAQPVVVLRESLEGDLREFASFQSIVRSETASGRPDEFSMKNKMTGVRDQGAQGSCSSFCAVACLEHIYPQDLSEAQVQHESETDCKEGLPLAKAFRTCRRPGAVREEVWPYDVTQVCWPTPPSTKGKRRRSFHTVGKVYHRSRATVFQRQEGEGASDPSLVLRIQQSIVERKRPVGISVPVWWSAWPKDGKISLPRGDDGPTKADGWHAITICGWQGRVNGRFLFKNSWGVYWGAHGYGTIPYRYVEKYSDIGLIGY